MLRIGVDRPRTRSLAKRPSDVEFCPFRTHLGRGLFRGALIVRQAPERLALVAARQYLWSCEALGRQLVETFHVFGDGKAAHGDSRGVGEK